MIYFIHNRNAENASNTLWDTIPTKEKNEIPMVDWYSHNGKKYRPKNGMKSPKNYLFLNPHKIPSFNVKIPKYYDAEQRKNIAEYYKEFPDYATAKAFETSVNQRAVDSPPLPENEIPEATPQVKSVFNQAIKMANDNLDWIINYREQKLKNGEEIPQEPIEVTNFMNDSDKGFFAVLIAVLAHLPQAARHKAMVVLFGGAMQRLPNLSEEGFRETYNEIVGNPTQGGVFKVRGIAGLYEMIPDIIAEHRLQCYAYAKEMVLEDIEGQKVLDKLIADWNIQQSAIESINFTISEKIKPH